MSPAFLDIVAAFAINLLIIVILLHNTVYPFFYRAHPHYHLLVLTNLCDSFRKLSSFGNLCSVVFCHPPSSCNACLISSRSGAIYSGLWQRSYSAWVAAPAVVCTEAKLVMSSKCASLPGCLSTSFAVSIIHCRRSSGLAASERLEDSARLRFAMIGPISLLARYR